jgi:mono/diheme cytochrome c family protein
MMYDWRSRMPKQRVQRAACRLTARLFTLCVLIVCGVPAVADEPPRVSPEDETFFESKVRPILAAHCLECHGPKKQESGLRLDSRQAVLAGGDSGERAIVPGDPQRSLLIQAVRHEGDYRMPPRGKLPEEAIAALTEWVQRGAPWPVSSQAAPPPASAAALVEEHRRSHWAYQPVLRPELPPVRQADWPRQRLDTLVLAGLEAAGLTPSPEADRRTLIRRLTFDLHGLPPTPHEVEAFVADPAPDALERLVDRLLASPRYGERWGRHWLDVARYADTKGYAFAQERRYPYAYTYRDWVIRALNRDLPYDEFIRQQLAADLLPPAADAGEQRQRLAALGFLTTGRRFNNRHDDLDDQIDAVSRGLLGLTVACARCHDHKYDAIPTEDYYSLQGIFASCREPAELPLLIDADASPEYQKYVEGLVPLKKALDDFAEQKYRELVDQSRRQAADYLARCAAGPADSLLARLPFMSLDPKDLRPRLVERWRRYIEARSRPDDPVWGLWHELLQLPVERFAEQAAEVVARWQARPAGTAPGQCNPLLLAAVLAEPPRERMDLPRLWGRLLVQAYEAWLSGGGNAQALAALPDAQRQLAEELVGPQSPVDIPRDDLRQYLSRADRNKYTELQKKIETYQVTSPLAPPRAMVVVDEPRPVEPRVLIRGNPSRPGAVVPRQFLLVLAGPSRQPFRDGSGRRELAEAIVDPSNPLTRRVIVNRLWMHHFGEPLVLSPSDFGVRTDPPANPALLDELAAELWHAGWSLKALHRALVTSSTYRQASLDRPECRRVDPENRLWWRMHRRRLELEPMRDTLLAVAGQLDLAMYGRPVELTKPPFSRRRAVYGFIDRQDLPGMFRVFDIASPDQSSPRRPRTTVPQQALFFMNSPLVVEQAKALASRPDVTSAGSDDERIAALYRLVLLRQPDPEEVAISRELLAAAGQMPAEDVRLSPWEILAQTLLSTNELLYID